MNISVILKVPTRALISVMMIVLGLVTPAHAGPLVVAPGIEVQAPDLQPTPVAQVVPVAYRSQVPTAVFLVVRATARRSAWCIQYAYAGGDPVNRWDPSGLDWLEIRGDQVFWIFTEKGTDKYLGEVAVGKLGTASWNTDRHDTGWFTGNHFIDTDETANDSTVFWSDRGNPSDQMKWLAEKGVSLGHGLELGRSLIDDSPMYPMASRLSEVQAAAKNVHLLDEIAASGQNISRYDAVMAYRDYFTSNNALAKLQSEDRWLGRGFEAVYGPGRSGPSYADLTKAGIDTLQVVLAAKAALQPTMAANEFAQGAARVPIGLSVGSVAPALQTGAPMFFESTQAYKAAWGQMAAAERAGILQAALPVGSRGRVTMGAGAYFDSAGQVRIAISTSEGTNALGLAYIRPQVLPSLYPWEQIVAGPAGMHAEMKLLHMFEPQPFTIGAGRPICLPVCQPELQAWGVTPATPLGVR